jgi:hypothetical protein
VEVFFKKVGNCSSACKAMEQILSSAFIDHGPVEDFPPCLCRLRYLSSIFLISNVSNCLILNLFSWNVLCSLVTLLLLCR